MNLKTIDAVGIIAKPRREVICEVVPGLSAWLAKRGVKVHLDCETAACLGGEAQGLPREELPDRVDLLVVLGGDGTVLAAARAVHGRSLPLLAVNLGGMGFLTAVTLNQMYAALEEILAGRQEEDCRKMLMVELVHGGETVAAYHALNDAVLNKAVLARILDFEVSVDGEFVSNYKADGLIFSTPTGSTAYSLSAGGPITFPAVEALIITPICSHTLNHRPLVVPDRSVIEVLIHSQEESAHLTVDGQVGIGVHDQDRILCRCSPYLTRLVRPPGKGYWEILRSKLKWGQR